MVRIWTIRLLACLIAATVAALMGCAGMVNPREEVELVDVDTQLPTGPFLVGGIYKKTPYKGYMGVSVVSEDGDLVRGFGGRVLIDSTKSLETGDRIYLQLAILKRGRGEPPGLNFYRAIRAPG